MLQINSFRRTVGSVLIILAAIAIFSNQVAAKTTCQPMQYAPQYWGGPMAPIGQNCVSEVEFANFYQKATTQVQSQWCWAAVISMIFDYYGYSVSQDRIVREAYGAAYNWPAKSGEVIAREINRSWIDDRNRRFSATVTSAYDAFAGFNATTNDILINELHNERPFIIGTKGHAVVGTSMQYWRFPNGMTGKVSAVGVFDPWPTAQRARGLTLAEMTAIHNGGQLSFIATLSVRRF